MRSLGSASLSLSMDPDEKVVFYFALSPWILMRSLGSASLSLFMDTVEKVGFYFFFSP